MPLLTQSTVAIIGLGYVGLPLAIAFGIKMRTIGFDINKESIASYKEHHDPNGEVSKGEFKTADKIIFTSDPKMLEDADFIIIAVPTPIDKARQPDLSPLKNATTTAGKNMQKGATVIFESTVYPGTTEEVCVPILENTSSFSWKNGFNVGYSPERINPGDKEHTLAKIVKVVSGDCAQTLGQVASLYETIITAGVYRASSIKVAEAAKVIENTQRDLNIALMNELALIFDRLEIDTLDVLEAAGTKWNFLPFRPGLVGGHCIGVDPYYLTYKAESVDYHPQVILAGRRINDNMGKFIAEKAVKLMLCSKLNISKGRVGIIGLTFKENCPDLRNSKVFDIIDELKSYGITVLIHDPRANQLEAEKLLKTKLSSWEDMQNLSGLIFAVPHKEVNQIATSDLISTLIPGGCLIDIKSALDETEIKKHNINFWRL